jgi:gamma-glutamyltranspeptidase/glutathione hydrolase
MKQSLSRREMLVATANLLVVAAVAPSCVTAKRHETRGIVLGDVAGAKAAEQVFADNGNAIDAAIAAAFVAGVSSPSKCGIGGYGGSMMIARHGKIYCIDFNSVAPSAARPDMYPLDKNGNVVGKVNFHGWLAAGVPGTPAGLQLALQKFGTMSLREVLRPAILLAGQKSSTPYFKYETLRETLTTFADRNSVDSFYRGDIAQQIADTFAQNGGLVTTKDLAAYHARVVTPYSLQWDDTTVYTAPLCSGGLTPLQALSIFKSTRWPHEPSTPQRTHAQIEALRLAWRDRGLLLGDPDFVEVPVEKLLSTDYARDLEDEVEATVRAHIPLPLDISNIQQTGTVNISAADRDGNLVALTLTMGNGYGAHVAIESLGIALGHGMARFDPQPSHPNSVAPGKRPLHNMCPSILCIDGQPTIAIGAAGGTKIPNALYEFFCNYLGERQSFAQAVDGPRFNTTGSLELHVENGFASDQRSYLKQIGFKLSNGPGPFVSAVRIDHRTGALDGRNHIGDPFESRAQGS